MGVNGINIRNLSDTNYNEMTDCRYDTQTKNAKPLNVINDSTNAPSNYIPTHNTKSPYFDLLMSDEDEIPNDLNLDLSETWDVVDSCGTLTKKVEANKVVDKRDLLLNGINDSPLVMRCTNMFVSNQPFVPTLDYDVPEGVMGLNNVYLAPLYHLELAQLPGHLERAELQLRSKIKKANLKIQVMFVNGDIQGGDTFCG